MYCFSRINPVFSFDKIATISQHTLREISEFPMEPPPPPPLRAGVTRDTALSPMMTRGKSARNLAQDRIRQAKQQVLPRFHPSVNNKENVLKFYEQHPDSFVEHSMTLDQLKKIYGMLQLYCLDRNFTNSELLERLPLSSPYCLVTFIGGNWWRLSRSQKQRRLVAWRRQKLAYSSQGSTLVEDEARTNSLKRDQIEIVGIWCRAKTGGRISKEPFFGIKGSIRFTLEGKPMPQPLTEADTERLRIEMATAAMGAASLSPPPPTTDTGESQRTQTVREMEMVAQSIVNDAPGIPPDTCMETQSSQETDKDTSSRRESSLESQTTAQRIQQQQQQPTDPPIEEVIPEGADTRTNSQQQKTLPQTQNLPDGFQIIKATAAQKEGSKKTAEIPCGSFQSPKGVVPRMLYGGKGRRFINMLNSRADRTGNELLLTWLNLPGLFQNAQKKNRTISGDTEERLKRLAVRKFTYGNVGQAFKVLQRKPQTKTEPTDEEIDKLFPKETSNEEILHPARGDTNIAIGIEQLTRVVSKLPRDRACGESQLSYDHIKYAVMRDETAASLLHNAVNFLLNNPEKVDKSLYSGTAYFLQKGGGKLRPIVLQETITKVAHKCLNIRLLNILKEKMPPHQYCINHSNGTTQATLGIQNEIKGERARYIVAVDFTNAFNSLSRHTLMENMVRMGIDSNITSYVATYLNRFTVRHKERIIKNGRGVPQGCPLSMTLFAIGTSHLIKIIERMGVRVYAYADDMALVADTKQEMEEAVDVLETKAKECGLSLNRAKTKYFTLKDEDEDGFTSLAKVSWTYLGIPISLDQQLVKDSFSRTVDRVAEMSAKAWEAPLLQQAYFIERLCVGPMLTHVARGTDLQGDIDTFLTEQQKKLEAHQNPVIKQVPKAWRVQPVRSGGLGLTDIRMVQKAAREALLVEAGEKEPDPGIGKREGDNAEEDRETRWQRVFTSMLQELIINEHKTKMRLGREKETHEPTTTGQYDSLWLASPPVNPAQVLSDSAFKIAIQLRYDIDDIAQLRKKCPFCGKQITLQHCLACGRANAGTVIARHNTITRIIGTHIAAQGTIVEYEKKLPFHSETKPHIPDITYMKDTVQHHIDVAVCQRRGKQSDMRQTAIASKTYKYKKTWGAMFSNVHFVIFDNEGRPAEGVANYLEGLGIGPRLIKTMQSVILKANETCYKRVISRIAEVENGMHASRSRSMMIPLDIIEDTA